MRWADINYTHKYTNPPETTVNTVQSHKGEFGLYKRIGELPRTSVNQLARTQNPMVLISCVNSVLTSDTISQSGPFVPQWYHNPMSLPVCPVPLEVLDSDKSAVLSLRVPPCRPLSLSGSGYESEGRRFESCRARLIDAYKLR